MNTSHTIHLFVPCLVRDVLPDIGRASVSVLRRLGFTVACPPGQTCCGQLLYKQGYKDQTAPLALRFMDIFKSAKAVVAPSASCVAMVRAYPELFEEGSPERLRALRLAEKTFEFTQFVASAMGQTPLDAKLSAPLEAVYHGSCQAERGLGVKHQPRWLLGQVAGLTLHEAPQPACCGFGGGFSMTHPDVSLAILEEKTASFMATGATTVIGVEPSCLVHMEGYFRKQNLPLRTLHAAQVLAMGLQNAPGGPL